MLRYLRIMNVNSGAYIRPSVTREEVADLLADLAREDPYRGHAQVRLASSSPSGVVELLIESLEVADVEAIRPPLIWVLGNVIPTPPEAVFLLEQIALNPKESEDTRKAAICSLGSIGERAESSTQALIKILTDDKSSSLKLFAAVALTKMGPRAKKELEELLLKDIDVEVKDLVRTVLNFENKPATITPIKTPIDPSVPEFEESIIIPLYEQLIQGNNDALQDQAAVELVKIGEGAVPYLKIALRSNKQNVRLNAAWALGRLSSTSSVGAITTELEIERDPIVKRFMIWALGKMGVQANSALPILEELLRQDPDQVTKDYLVDAFDNIIPFD